MKKIPTIHELRQQGYKVRVTHVRKFYRFDPRSGKKIQFYAPFQSSKTRRKDYLHPQTEELLESKRDGASTEFFICGKGGETIIEIASSEHKELGKGISVCSEQDSYVKSIGIKKAVALALRNMEANKDPYFHIRQFFSK